MDVIVDVIAHGGDRHLGGEDFDQRIFNYASDYLKDNYDFEVSSDKKAKRVLELASKKLKEELSYSAMSTLSVPFIGVKNNQPISLELDITQAKFEELTNDLANRTIELLDQMLKSNKINKKEINKVLLVGGSTRIPKIIQLVEDYIDFKPSQEMEPDLAVSLGAAIQASIIKGETETIIMDRVAYGFGVKSVGLYGNQMVQNYYSEIIKPNSPMNKEFTEQFETIHEAQDKLEINCYQREPSQQSKNVEDLEPIGKKILVDNLPKVSGQTQQVNISMAYNLNGIIEMKVEIVSTGEIREFEIQTATGTLHEKTKEKRKEQLNKLWKQSRFADEAKSLINAVESRLDKMKEEDAENVKIKLDELKQALVDEDHDKIEELKDEISDIIINY